MSEHGKNHKKLQVLLSHLQALYDFLLVDGLCARKEAGIAHSLDALLLRHGRELGTSERLPPQILFLYLRTPQSSASGHHAQ